MAETVNMNVSGRPNERRGILPGQGRAAWDKRPNIVLIISDEHNAGVGDAGDVLIW